MLGVSVVILVVMTLGARRAIRDLSQRLIEQSSDRAEDAMERFFGQVGGMLASSRAWWDAGILGYEERDDLARLDAVFMPVLDQHREITSMMLVHDGGFEYLLFRDLRGGDGYE